MPITLSQPMLSPVALASCRRTLLIHIAGIGLCSAMKCGVSLA